MIRGVDFTADGAARSLRFTTNRMVDLEAAVGCSVVDFMQRFGGGAVPSYADMRLVFRAGLWPAASLEEAGDIMDEIGFDRASELIGEALIAAFPQAEAGRGAENPRVAAAE